MFDLRNLRSQGSRSMPLRGGYERKWPQINTLIRRVTLSVMALTENKGRTRMATN